MRTTDEFTLNSSEVFPDFSVIFCSCRMMSFWFVLKFWFVPVLEWILGLHNIFQVIFVYHLLLGNFKSSLLCDVSTSFTFIF